MRVTHFIHRHTPEYSGAGRQAELLARHLDSLGVRSTFVAFSERSVTATDGDGSVVRIPLARPSKAGAVANGLRVIRSIISSSPQLVHVHGYYPPALLAALILRVPVILKTTLLGVDDLASLFGTRPAIECSILRRVDLAISLTSAMEQRNARVFGRTVVIPNGIALRARERATRTARRTTSILFAGGDSERKGFWRIGEFFQYLSAYTSAQLELIIAGAVRDENLVKLRERCNRLGVHLEVAGLVPDLRPLLDRADCFLSLAFAEGLPNAVLEAVAVDVFVCASDIPGTFDGLIGVDNGVVFAPDALQSGARALAEAINGGRLVDVDNHVRIAPFDIERVAERYISVYRQLVGVSFE